MDLFFINKVYDFRPVHKYPWYFINEFGIVYSEKRKCFCNFVVDGFYLRIRLSKNWQKKKLRVHQLVCRAFNGPPPTKHRIINHKDMNTFNNHYTNLEWSNDAKNQQHKHQNWGWFSKEEKLIKYGSMRTLSVHQYYSLIMQQYE